MTTTSEIHDGLRGTLEGAGELYSEKVGVCSACGVPRSSMPERGNCVLGSRGRGALIE